MKLRFGFFDLFEASVIDKKVLNWLFVLFFGLFAAGILILIVAENKAGACDRSKQEFLKFEYQGKIIRTYRSANHGHWMTVLEDGTKKALLFDYKIWETLQPGDILIKHKNELNFTIISGKDTTHYREKIPDCAQFKDE